MGKADKDLDAEAARVALFAVGRLADKDAGGREGCGDGLLLVGGEECGGG